MLAEEVDVPEVEKFLTIDFGVSKFLVPDRVSLEAEESDFVTLPEVTPVSWLSSTPEDVSLPTTDR